MKNIQVKQYIKNTMNNRYKPIYIYIYIYVGVYIYIYIERERERVRERVSIPASSVLRV